jgi:hypothetical protein
MNKFTLIAFLALALGLFYPPSDAAAQSASGGVGGVIMTFDPENLFKENAQLMQAYKTFKEVQEISNYQKLISKTLGLKEDQIAFLRELGNIANTICNFKVPQFFFNADFNFRLPDFPTDPCDLALTFLPYDQDYFQTFMGNVNQGVNDPQKVYKAMRDPQKAKPVIREQLWLAPGETDTAKVLNMRKTREEVAQKHTQDMLVNATTAQAQMREAYQKIDGYAKTNPDTQIAQLTLISQQLAEMAKTDLAIMNAMAERNKSLAYANIKESQVTDPGGNEGRMQRTADGRLIMPEVAAKSFASLPDKSGQPVAAKDEKTVKPLSALERMGLPKLSALEKTE